MGGVEGVAAVESAESVVVLGTGGASAERETVWVVVCIDSGVWVVGEAEVAQGH